MYNQSNIESPTSQSFHVVLVYSNENNVSNDRYNFDETADDFCANVFVFSDGKLIIESAMVEVRPEMSYVFVSKSGEPFFVLKSISGEIRYIKVREEDEGIKNCVQPISTITNEEDLYCTINETNMHVKRSIQVFVPTESCRSGWYWSDHNEKPSSSSSSKPTRCNCHECNVEFGVHNQREATTIFDSIKFLALLLQHYYKIPCSDIIDAESVVIGQSEHCTFIIKAIGCIVKYVNQKEGSLSRKSLLFKIAFRYEDGQCHLLGISDLNALTTGKRGNAFQQFRHLQTRCSSKKSTWLNCAVEFYKKLELGRDPILSQGIRQCKRFDNFGIISVSSLKSILHPLKYYEIVNDDEWYQL